MATEVGETPWVAEPGERFGARLQRLAEGGGHRWRRLWHQRHASREQAGSLEGVVESLLYEIGHALDSPPAAGRDPWARANGVLRLSVERGPEGLDEEFDLLDEVGEDLADQLQAAGPQRRALRRCVAIARALAHQELGRLSGGPEPEVRFGGVVVEVFEPSSTRH